MKTTNEARKARRERETYIGSDGTLHRHFRTGRDDHSPLCASYHPACSCCFLNFSHSQNYHDQSIAQKGGA